MDGKPKSTPMMEKRERKGHGWVFMKKAACFGEICEKKTHVSNTHEICFREFSLRENKVPIE